VWLPAQQQMLSADKLVADAKGWKAISDFVADQLRERVATRLSGEDMDPSQLQESLRNASRMIADGTGPQADNFSQFQPLTDDKGQITALRFVFPPYQVGPYSDGTQTADVPASVLLPHVAKDYVEQGITINALAPAVIRTAMVDALPQATVDYMTAKIPMKRCGELEEAAKLIAWIVSPACSFTTGFTFDLSGGRATY